MGQVQTSEMLALVPVLPTSKQSKNWLRVDRNEY